jgi:hypothetical protein
VPDHRAGGLARGRVALLATQLRAEPGQQLVHHERLGHVVVGAGVERADLVTGRREIIRDDNRESL